MTTFVNMTELADKLSQQGSHPQLVEAIKDCHYAASALGDLLTVREAVAKLIEIQDDEALNRAFGAALTTHAVVIYCRAMAKKNNARPHVDVIRDFTDSDLLLHNEIVSLRDKAIAHIDRPKGQFAIVWRKEAVALLSDAEGNVCLSFPTTTAIALPTLKEALLNLSEKAIVTATGIRDGHQKKAAEEFMKFSHPQEFQDIVRSCLTEVEEFYGVETELAERMFHQPRHSE